MIDKLKDELYECINLYGILDNRTVEKSQELDLEIIKNIINHTSIQGGFIDGQVFDGRRCWYW